ncbi:unnamed protein product, partial [Iphiclides podalirius]
MKGKRVESRVQHEYSSAPKIGRADKDAKTKVEPPDGCGKTTDSLEEWRGRLFAITHRHRRAESGCAVPVLVVVALTGVKICDPDDQSVRMSHALRRISYATCEAARALFAFVAREPRADPAAQYCHAFETDTPEQIEERRKQLNGNTTLSTLGIALYERNANRLVLDEAAIVPSVHNICGPIEPRRAAAACKLKPSPGAGSGEGKARTQTYWSDRIDPILPRNRRRRPK